jgi:hypothetical protein
MIDTKKIQLEIEIYLEPETNLLIKGTLRYQDKLSSTTPTNVLILSVILYLS